MSEKEKNLLKKLTQGDTNAFATLFHAHWQTVYNMSYKYTLSHSDAEDISQEVFQRIWEKRKSIIIHKTFENYIVRTTKNHIINHFRAKDIKRQHEKIATQLVEQATPFVDTPPLRSVESKYQQLVALLPPRSQEIYIRKYEKHLTNEDLATEMGLSIKTVEYHLQRAHKMMREEIKKSTIYF
ncbi:RNA polymerase sigma factor [Sphingobacterium corticibacterium]|nr:sigma-70 family RNA polymerase sigma factor [Sphingobacterium corticibacterium]